MSANSRPFLLGLTGGIATGKTTASQHLRELGATVIDADEISRALTAEGGQALPIIRAQFGDSVFHPDGTLDRRALGQLVFADAAQRRRLEAILHPAVQRVMLDEIERAREPLVVLAVPLLFETGMDALCDQVWVTTLDPQTQIKRLMDRDGLTKQQAEARIESQLGPEERNRRGGVSIRTDRPIQDTAKEISKLYMDLLRRIGE